MQIVFKLKLNGWGEYFDSRNLPACFGVEPSKFNFDLFRRVCIVAGCDYAKDVFGVGIKKATDIILKNDFHEFDQVIQIQDASINLFYSTIVLLYSIILIFYCLQICQELKKYVRKGHDIPPDYIQTLMRAEETFLHQLVFDLNERKVVNLTTPPEDWNDVAKDFVGTKMDCALAEDIAIGNIDCNTFESLKYSDGPYIIDDLPTTSIWCPGFVLGVPVQIPKKLEEERLKT